MLLPAAWSLTFAAIGGAGGGGGGGLGESKNPIDLEARSLGLWWRRALGGRREGFSRTVGKFLSFRFLFSCFIYSFFLLKLFYYSGSRQPWQTARIASGGPSALDVEVGMGPIFVVFEYSTVQRSVLSYKIWFWPNLSGSHQELLVHTSRERNLTCI